MGTLLFRKTFEAAVISSGPLETGTPLSGMISAHCYAFRISLASHPPAALQSFSALLSNSVRCLVEFCKPKKVSD